MVRFNGEVRFPYPRSQIAERLADARFLAACAPGAAVHAADSRTANWTAPSRFRWAVAPIETTLMMVRDQSAASFQLVNRLPGATLTVAGRFEFTDDGIGTCVVWSAEVVERTGLIKMVPKAVLQAQIEAELTDLWNGVRRQLDETLAGS